MAQQGSSRDFLYIALGVGLVFGLLFAYSGIWPPVVVVETNSMMHVDRAEYFSGEGSARADHVPFGRMGTMDAGDLVLLKKVDSLDEVETFATGSDASYKARGDVIAYKRPVNDDDRPIIHRAMTYVDVVGTGEQRSYRVHWSPEWRPSSDCVRTPVYVCEFGPGGVTIPELGLRRATFLYDGFLTKGDNSASNPGADQAGDEPLMPQPVRLDEIVGKAQFELPSVGLLKLAFSGNTIKNAEVQDHQYFVRIGNVVAPYDTWALLVVEFVLLSLSPLLWSMLKDFTAEPSRRIVPELAVLEEAWRETESARASKHGQPRPGQAKRPS